MVPSFPQEITSIITRDDLTLAYSGEFRDTLTDRIIELAETYLDKEREVAKLRKKTSFLVAECFQNVIRHGSKEAEFIFDSPRRVESFVLRFYDKKCFILSENAIPASKVEGLVAMMEDVNKVDRDELRTMYRRLLDEGELSEKGGAGLGLIEMARRSGNKLKYSFQPLDEAYRVFHLMLVLESAVDREKVPDYSADFIQIEQILTHLKSENHFLVYHGTLDHEFNVPITQMIERNLDAQYRPMALKVKYYHAAIMVMDLVASHNQSLEHNDAGVIALGITDDGYKIHSTSFISPGMKDRVEQVLQQLEVSEKEHTEEFSDHYLQLARIGRSWKYNFTPREGNYEFNYHVLI
jgi:hypothetical protein